MRSSHLVSRAGAVHEQQGRRTGLAGMGILCSSVPETSVSVWYGNGVGVWERKRTRQREGAAERQVTAFGGCGRGENTVFHASSISWYMVWNGWPRGGIEQATEKGKAGQRRGNQLCSRRDGSVPGKGETQGLRSSVSQLALVLLFTLIFSLQSSFDLQCPLPTIQAGARGRTPKHTRRPF